MTTEDMLRQALRDEADALAPPLWPAAPVRAAARARLQRRRARRTALAVAAALAVPAAAALLGTGTGTGTGTVRTAPGAAPARSAPPATISDTPSPLHVPSAAKTVTAGQDVSIGRGHWLRLTADQSCEGSAQDPAQCSATVGGNQAAGSVSLRTSGDSGGTFFLPLYTGPGRAARMTVTVAGRTYPATVVTLPGHPGYATGYAWVPQTDGQPAVPSGESVTVYGPDGAALAELATG
ncbi:hypothetical protein [Streptacidiphilus sp. P02-A3a]|uniref:hypothetical protein n=1 Tax=Streptacidiphilus sp. P02-A3a TaxID=2704468 RepID=UPI0015FDA782|nr:hypothetical protein [Streptacidiphilus sp. P02-A3a]QMU70131.1 hypothetical protein GXP74_19750 [Streptacidiphilus sp. P02-A3a]QMU70420.1 hypothetical protein GXP74_21610 [Streptacidiphilus sp. P02-A3a]